MTTRRIRSRFKRSAGQRYRHKKAPRRTLSSLIIWVSLTQLLIRLRLRRRPWNGSRCKGGMITSFHRLQKNHCHCFGPGTGWGAGAGRGEPGTCPFTPFFACEKNTFSFGLGAGGRGCPGAWFGTKSLSLIFTELPFVPLASHQQIKQTTFL